MDSSPSVVLKAAKFAVMSITVPTNTPDIFLNGSTRLSEFMVQGSSYFFKVSSASDLEKKILSTAE